METMPDLAPHLESKTDPEITVERLYIGQPGYDEALQVEQQVFAESGYISDKDSDGHMKEYNAYNANSIINVARVNGQVVGVLREIHQIVEQPDSTGFKTLDDMKLDPEYELWAKEQVEDNTLVEAGTAAVLKEYRGHELNIAPRLYNALFSANARSGYPKTFCIASIDSRLLNAFRARKFLPFEDIGPTVDYMGSLTTPVMLDLTTIADTLKQDNPFAYKMLIKGEF